MTSVYNPHAGEVAITIGDRTCALVYDWAAIASLTDAFGKKFDSALGEAMDRLDTAVLARALEIGLRKHHAGELDAAAIMQASPPLVAVNSAISEALTRAFWGAEPPQVWSFVGRKLSSWPAFNASDPPSTRPATSTKD